MDEDRLSGCTKQVEEGLKVLEDAADVPVAMNPQYSRAFFVLDMVDSALVETYLENWTESEYELGLISLEFPEAIAFLKKLHDNRGRNAREEFNELLAEITRFQNITGRIDNHHGAALFSLVQFDSHPDAVQRAIEYFLTDYIDIQSGGMLPSDGGLGLQALMETDYFEFEDDICEIFKKLDSNYKEEQTNELYLNALSDLVMSLSMLRSHSFPIQAKLEDDLKEHLSDLINKSPDELYDSEFASPEELYIRDLARTLHGLIAAGHGPKTSQFLAEWQNELQIQRQGRTQPRFLATRPSTRLDERKIEIQRQAEQMIQSAENSIRISTLRMDMLHDELIDRIIRDPDFDVKILTSSSRPSGSRSKMKRAVMDEMVKRTQGQVREDELIHTRMIVADESGALISSADLTRDQLNDEFNAGIYTQDPETVEKSIDLFDEMWAEATPRNTG